MSELICHLFGDYVLQNATMATRKTSSWLWASVHVAFYMLPFVLVFRLPLLAFAVMAGTHLVIDRFRLARYWCQFWGVGQEGIVCTQIRLARDELERRGTQLHGDEHWEYPKAHLDPRPVPAATPDYLAVWLVIIVDNTAHLLINHLSLTYLG